MKSPLTYGSASNSCGVGLIQGLISMDAYYNKEYGTKEEFYALLLAQLISKQERKHLQLMFTHQTNLPFGFALKKYIEEHKLGTVVESQPSTNPNYTDGHLITVWVFTRDEKAWKEHFKDKLFGDVDAAKIVISQGIQNIQVWEKQIKGYNDAIRKERAKMEQAQAVIDKYAVQKAAKAALVAEKKVA